MQRDPSNGFPAATFLPTHIGFDNFHVGFLNNQVTYPIPKCCIAYLLSEPVAVI